ncbi:replicative DNA helicase [Crenobacter cavernae]|uniref:DNA 5'-3' helicase n=1 Tax=Crenobacter cavernae TaxID=2290923 RepID=A0ABY0FAM3_9NEIS|nr:DnaB-like helicase C-terminal domain-containing protein [Crenobacter cavernae]RXZ42686.1 hypothetical protein EBB06_12390 [Crenobacter cavernae]
MSVSETVISREQCLLGVLLMKDMPEAAECLKANWFSSAEHQQIFEGVLALKRNGGDHTLFAVQDWLDTEYPLDPDRAGLRSAYLIELVQNSVSMGLASVIKAIADQGQRKEFRAALLAAAGEMDGHESYADAMSMALSRLDSMVMEGAQRGLISAREIAEIGVKWLDERMSNPDSLPGIPSGFDDLDEVIYGLKAGELITIAGATAMGKTTIASNIAEHVAKDRRVLVVTREMGESQIAIRHFASVGKVPMPSMQTGRMTDSEYDSLKYAVGVVAQSHLVYDLDSGTVNQIALRARQLQRKHGDLGLIVVDHIGLLESDRKRDARHLEVSDITRGLKQLSRELKLPVIQLVQVSRGVTDRANKRPTLSDLSESSSIEKDSDVVIAMYRDDYYHPDSPMKGMGEAIVLKNRMGPCKTVPLVFRGEINRFDQADKGEYARAKSIAEESKQPRKGASNAL